MNSHVKITKIFRMRRAKQNQMKVHVDLKLVRQKIAARRAAKIFGGKKGIYSQK